MITIFDSHNPGVDEACFNIKIRIDNSAMLYNTLYFLNLFTQLQNKENSLNLKILKTWPIARKISGNIVCSNRLNIKNGKQKYKIYIIHSRRLDNIVLSCDKEAQNISKEIFLCYCKPCLWR